MAITRMSFSELAWAHFINATTQEWTDPNTGDLMYGIALRNGAKFEGSDPAQVLHDAQVYHKATLRLTGETP